jgi:hypothetical protein
MASHSENLYDVNIHNAELSLTEVQYLRSGMLSAGLRANVVSLVFLAILTREQTWSATFAVAIFVQGGNITR